MTDEVTREPFKITINRDISSGDYVVEVLPPPDGIGHDRAFANRRSAYGYGSGLTLVTGWPLVDLTGESERARG